MKANGIAISMKPMIIKIKLKRLKSSGLSIPE
jgi:hypothetical protein